MAGLNYGNKYRITTDWINKDGVFFAPKIKKWIVRHNKTTIAKFETEPEAIKFYEAHTSTAICP